MFNYLLSCIFLCFLGYVKSLYTVIDSTGFCMFTEVPMSTNIVFSWDVRDAILLSEIDGILVVDVTFSDNGDEKIFQELLHFKGEGKEFYSGRLEFVAKSDYLHKTCVYRSDPQTLQRIYFDIDLTIGQDSKYYKRLAIDKGLDELELELVQLNDRLGMVLDEADFLKEKETLYHSKTEELSLDTVWWPVAQISLLIVTALIQIYAIRRFFKAHKVL